MAKFKLTLAANRQRALEVLERLKQAYPDAHCTLEHKGPFELLVATILAAQCTDKRVNVVTKTLFQKYRKAQDYLDVPKETLEKDVRTCGFFRQKAASIRKACATILDKFGGNVPGTLDELLELDGVGRKTANVVLAESFATPGVIVDTHCIRLSARLGFTKNTAPDKIERDLMKIWPEQIWTEFSHCLVFHGRAVCHSRAPQCSLCPLLELCPFPSLD